jgi:hypothetical protein
MENRPNVITLNSQDTRLQELIHIGSFIDDTLYISIRDWEFNRSVDLNKEQVKQMIEHLTYQLQRYESEQS